MAWAEVPPSRTARLVGNVLVETGSGEEGTVDVRSVVVLYRHRGDYEVEQWCGHRRDVLRRAGDGWKIARRTVHLAASGLPGRNLALFF
jgi:3-phenylpropionate/cinnamic acid dioxygenase small subunit